jgi:hypothetical protein
MAAIIFYYVFPGFEIKYLRRKDMFERTQKAIIAAGEKAAEATANIQEFSKERTWSTLGKAAGNTVKAGATLVGLKTASLVGATLQSAGRATRLAVKTVATLPETVNGSLIAIEKAQNEAALIGGLEGTEMVLNAGASTVETLSKGKEYIAGLVKRRSSSQEPEQFIQRPELGTLKTETVK